MTEALLDPMFATPLAAGLAISLVLPLLGALLRLRDEWLAALGLAHLAGASGLVGLAAGVPVVLGASLGAVAGALAKSTGRIRGNTVYALMILIGWSLTLLVAANTSLGSVMGQALIEGQLYFAGAAHLTAAMVLIALTAIILPWVMPRLIRARLFPAFEAANELPAWRWHLTFDVLAALAIATGVAAVGLMGAFALAFVPPWVAFQAAASWRRCLALSLVIGASSYLLAFAAALLLDQPFGPVLVAMLVIVGALSRLLLRRPGGTAMN